MTLGESLSAAPCGLVRVMVTHSNPDDAEQEGRDVRKSGVLIAEDGLILTFELHMIISPLWRLGPFAPQITQVGRNSFRNFRGRTIQLLSTAGCAALGSCCSSVGARAVWWRRQRIAMVIGMRPIRKVPLQTPSPMGGIVAEALSSVGFGSSRAADTKSGRICAACRASSREGEADGRTPSRSLLQRLCAESRWATIY